MSAFDWEHVVKQDGTLDDEGLESREILYIGRNGKAVERIMARGQKVSAIFKPLTNTDTIGRELWVYEKLLPLLHVRYPQLYAHAKHRDAERFWAIYEDMGKLQHDWHRKTLIHAAQSIPAWHRLPLAHVPEGYQGHTPMAKEVWQQVSRVAPGWCLEETLAGHGWPQESIQFILSLFRVLPPQLELETVISHGDFHPMNLSRLSGGELLIMDWEYVHRNSVFWDLYNLLDITSPRYRKPVPAPELRREVLQAYLEHRDPDGMARNPVRFVEGYAKYALLHSLWILLLIGKDLQSSSGAETAALQAQQRETLQISLDLTEALKNAN